MTSNKPLRVFVGRMLTKSEAKKRARVVRNYSDFRRFKYNKKTGWVTLT